MSAVPQSGQIPGQGSWHIKIGPIDAPRTPPGYCPLYFDDCDIPGKIPGDPRQCYGKFPVNSPQTRAITLKFP